MALMLSELLEKVESASTTPTLNVFQMTEALNEKAKASKEIIPSPKTVTEFDSAEAVTLSNQKIFEASNGFSKKVVYSDSVVFFHNGFVISVSRYGSAETPKYSVSIKKALYEEYLFETFLMDSQATEFLGNLFTNSDVVRFQGANLTSFKSVYDNLLNSL